MIKFTPETIDRCERSIILAADHVSKLREPDVLRVVQEYFFTHGTSQELIDYISENRPELMREALACQIEVGDTLIVIKP